MRDEKWVGYCYLSEGKASLMGLNRKVLSSPGGGIALRLMRAIGVSIRCIGEPDTRFSKRDYIDCFFDGSPKRLCQKNMVVFSKGYVRCFSKGIVCIFF
jgi:hypothetical protein